MPMLCFPRHPDFPLIRPNISDCGVDLFSLHFAALRCTVKSFVLLGCWNNNPWVNPVVTLGAVKSYVTQASLHLTSLQYSVLECAALQYTSLQYTALNCTGLHPTAHGKYPLSKSRVTQHIYWSAAAAAVRINLVYLCIVWEDNLVSMCVRWKLGGGP